ncbi:TonB-dependent siderophore receptor [Marinomonas sp. UCMA 3892]|uniref:TonB-dependent receptor n=1 Tax=unclassified Marinomonas TaxID=196814 RepID=UPI00146D0DF5|nr:TonB-dependent siderophore receptor [Marinomonas sp. UCMA 3892]NLU99485.1 TonB-dependent siderophore receptor [Marinomonas sp. UCMA 3892]
MYSSQYAGNETKTKKSNQETLFLKYHAAKNALYAGIAAGTVFLYSQSAYAETQTTTKENNAVSAVALPEITVEDSREKKPVYSGSNGQVLETSHTGFLGDKDALDNPFNAISYTDKYIQDQQSNDISDVISATDPSVHSTNTSGESRESYSIRGFSFDSNDATVNGLAGMAPYYRSATEMYESVDVQKGPSAMLNGMPPSGSIGGSINLVTKRAGNDPLTRLTTKYLSDSQVGASVDVSRRFGQDKQFGIRVNGAYLSGDGTIDHQENESQLGAIALDWRSSRIRLSADIYHTKENVDAPTRGINLAKGLDIPRPPSNDTLLNPSWNFFESETKGAMARGEFDINDQLTAYASVGITKWDYHGLSADKAEIYNSAGDIKTTLGATGDDNQRKSLEIGLNGRFQTGAVKHQVATNITRYEEEYNLYAARFKGVTIDSNIYNPVWGTRPDLDLNLPLLTTTETTLSSFGLADTLSFADDKYQLTLGARHQQIKTKETGGILSTGADYNKSAISPSAALIIKLADQVSAYANYIEGLSKGPTAPTTADNAGKKFAPYKTKQKEVGLKLDLGDFSHTVSLYEIEKPNSYTDPNTKLFGIYGEQRNRGVEWSFFGTPVDHIRLMGGLTHIEADLRSTSNGDNNGKQSAGVPKWQAKLGAEWDTPYIQNLTLIVNANSISKQYLEDDNKRSIPGYTIFGLGARYVTSVNQQPLTIRANINNLTDKDAWTTASYNALGLVEGRSLTLSASMDF